MSPSYSCGKCPGSDFVLVAPVFKIVPAGVLARLWGAFTGNVAAPRKVRSGFLARCTHHGCGRDWIITEQGVHEPSSRSVPGRALPSEPPPSGREKDRDDDKEPAVRDGLATAVRRPEV